MAVMLNGDNGGGKRHGNFSFDTDQGRAPTECRRQGRAGLPTFAFQSIGIMSPTAADAGPA